jgi:hypothetical protein
MFDDSSGTLAADSSSLRNDGVLIGGAAWVPANAAQPAALSFDGVDGYVEIAGSVAYATQHAAFSFTAWFNLTDLSQIPEQDIMQLRTDTATPWHVLLSNDPTWMGISLGSGADWATIKTGSVPSTGAWHHLAVTYSGADPSVITNFGITFDGAAQSLAAAGGYGGQPQGSRIGGSTGGNQFKGSIRDVRIYDRVLTTGEIADIFAGRR